MIKKYLFFFIIFVPVFLLVQYLLFNSEIDLKMVIQAILTGVISIIITLFLEKRTRKQT